MSERYPTPPSYSFLKHQCPPQLQPLPGSSADVTTADRSPPRLPAGSQ